MLINQKNTSLGLKFKAIREIRNYSQVYVASRLGIGQTTNSRIELDEIDVTSLTKIMGFSIKGGLSVSLIPKTKKNEPTLKPFETMKPF